MWQIFTSLQNICNVERIFARSQVGRRFSKNRQFCSFSQFDYRLNTFDVSHLVFLSFLLFLCLFPFAYNTQSWKRAVSMGKLKSKDKSRSCDKWRTYVPSFHIYYLCPPRRSTPRLENMFPLSSQRTLSQTHLHTYVRLEFNLLGCQFIYPKALIILRTALRASLNPKLIKLYLECD